MLRFLFGPSLLVLLVPFLSPPARAEPMFANGFEAPCAIADIDNDRLSACQEKLYKTDPNKRDTDDDGLTDGDEVLGTEGGLNLPGLGANPRRKDILIEHDWTDDDFECSQHSHEPPAAMLAEL